tara:strand:- start:4110 stop:4340 length:231 start_codon:yes stop_codon:yes gene_type:complete
MKAEEMIKQYKSKIAADCKEALDIEFLADLYKYHTNEVVIKELQHILDVGRAKQVTSGVLNFLIQSRIDELKLKQE